MRRRKITLADNAPGQPSLDLQLGNDLNGIRIEPCRSDGEVLGSLVVTLDGGELWITARSAAGGEPQRRRAFDCG